MHLDARHARGFARAMGLLACAAAAAACEGGDRGGTYEVDEVRTLREPRPVPGFPLPEAMRLRVQPPPRTAPRTAPAAAPPLAWTLPEGWTERPPSSMRVGDFRVPAHPELEAFINVSPGSGGGLVANLDRWRAQMGLPAAGPAGAAALPRVPALGGEATLLDVEGAYAGMGGGPGREGWRMLGAIAEWRGQTVFVKMTGPAAAVAAERDRFVALLASLRPGAPAADLPAGHPPVDGLPAGHPPVEGAAGASPAPRPSAYRWTVPEGWTVGPARAMREVTAFPAGHTDVECYVAVLGGDGGGLVANVNRWREQVGMPPLDDAGVAALPRVPVLGGTAPLVEGAGTFQGMSGDARAGFGLLGVIRELGQETVFVKMTGPADVLRGEKARFLAFCASLER